MKVDIGCGNRRHEGCIGIDYVAYPGVDIVCDINRGIPLPDHTASFVMACDVLQDVTDFMKTMREIYRLSRHKAIVCIVAPVDYPVLQTAGSDGNRLCDEQTLDETRQDFLPQAPGMEMDAPGIDAGSRTEAEPSVGEAVQPGPCVLAGDMLLQTGVDFRLLRQTERHHPDRIMYHLAVIKQDIRHEEWEQLLQVPLEEPAGLWNRQMDEYSQPPMEPDSEPLGEGRLGVREGEEPSETKSYSPRHAGKAGGKTRSSGRGDGKKSKRPKACKQEKRPARHKLKRKAV
ncbi:hypothetical protein [Paenibacillus sp. y28]|uniref:hypothetical protein n=1 Tax=Paenibacillus sp. y28 TaxID=3129110 RepID=UPI0030167E54